MTSTDTFARFVDTLAGCLDEHALSGDDLAARLHLSRYHCDRLVRSAAGEPPAALRRRVLLERAAYALVTSDATVLDVAIAPGYGSHEAFGRAFVKAYGVPPATWRRRPGQARIVSPNGVHFHPPGLLRLPGERKDDDMHIMSSLVAHHISTTRQIIDKAQSLSDADLDGPIEVSVDRDADVSSLRALCSRLVGQMDMWVATTQSRPYDFGVEEHEAVASIRERLERAAPAFQAEVDRVVGEDAWQETFVDAGCEPPKVFTYAGMISHVLTFSAYRRTLAILRLRQLGDESLGWGDPADALSPS